MEILNFSTKRRSLMDIVALFCKTDDFFLADAAHLAPISLQDGKRAETREHPRRLPPSEVMTRLIAFHQSGYRVFAEQVFRTLEARNGGLSYDSIDSFFNPISCKKWQRCINPASFLKFAEKWKDCRVAILKPCNSATQCLPGFGAVRCSRACGSCGCKSVIRIDL